MTAIENEKCFLDEELEILNKLFAKCYTDDDKEYTQMINVYTTNQPMIEVHDIKDDIVQINIAKVQTSISSKLTKKQSKKNIM